MKIQIKYEGHTEIFNGVDIDQTKDYTKVQSATYLDRVFKRHDHWLKGIPIDNEPLPMSSDSEHGKTYKEDESTTIDQIVALEEEYRFKHRSATGELIFTMVTIRPNINFQIIKLCQ